MANELIINPATDGTNASRSMERVNAVLADKSGNDIDSSNPMPVSIASGGNDIDVQNPLPTNGDSVYVKDINLDASDIGNFVSVNELPRTASVADFFNSLTTVNEDSTSNNPKEITIRFHRSVQLAEIGFGCNDGTKSFSNVKIEILGSNDELRTITDDSTNNTKYNSRVYSFEPETANSIKISFLTADSVGLSNLIIYKSTNVNARIQAIQPNNTLVDVSASNQGNLNVNVNEYGDTAAIDAFARLRISENFTIFDSKQLHDKQPLFWDEELGGSATSTHNPVNADVEMVVTASSSDYVIRQTKQRFNYQPGKSQLIFMTFQSEQVQGLTKRVGYFDGTGTNNLTPNNGIFYETNGGKTWNIAKNGTTTESIEQANWNRDKLDGTGPSGINLDTTSAQILLIDFEWLGVGRVRVGFVIDGLIFYCHEFLHANSPSFPNVYMSSPNLPLRYDIQSDGTAAGQLDHICSTVISEGGNQKTGILRVIDTGSTHIDASSANTIYVVSGIRLKSDYKDITVIPESLSMINENNDDFRWALHINPTITGTFTYSDLTNSAIQFAIGQANGSTQIIDEGIVIGSGYASTDTLSANQQLETALRIGSTIAGVQDELVLSVTPLSGGADIQASLSFRELL